MPQHTVALGLFVSTYYAVFLLVRHSVCARNLLLLFASYGFCAWLDARAPFYLLLSTTLTYVAGLLTERHSRWGQVAGWAAIIGHVALIFAWKGAQYFASDAQGPFESIIIPLGLSFYTFQAIGYIADVMKGSIRAERDFLCFATFQAFFPKLIAGPIERTSGLLAQLKTTQSITRKDLSEGLFLVTWGLVKKFTIAASAASIADPAFLSPWGLGPYNLIAVIAFTLQLYADFSGYSDIARGVSRMLGFRLQMNFLRPFAASSPDDFWRRWHISLSAWVRDYVYIPMGGNRKGYVRAALHVVLAMLIIGLWHGTAWTFVLWGLFHGAIIVLYRSFKGCLTLPKPLAICGFFTLNFIGWALFRSQNMELFGIMLQSAFSPAINPPPIQYAMPLLVCLALPLLAVEWWQSHCGDDETPSRSHWSLLLLFYVCCFYALILGAPASVTPFIYANF